MLHKDHVLTALAFSRCFFSLDPIKMDFDNAVIVLIILLCQHNYSTYKKKLFVNKYKTDLLNHSYPTCEACEAKISLHSRFFSAKPNFPRIFQQNQIFPRFSRLPLYYQVLSSVIKDVDKKTWFLMWKHLKHIAFPVQMCITYL